MGKLENSSNILTFPFYIETLCFWSHNRYTQVTKIYPWASHVYRWMVYTCGAHVQMLGCLKIWTCVPVHLEAGLLMYLYKLESFALKSVLVKEKESMQTQLQLCVVDRCHLKLKQCFPIIIKKGGATCTIWVAAECNDLPCSNEPPWILEMQAVLTCTLKLIHLDQCLQAPAAGDADRISRFHLQRKEVISMLSLPFKTWFPYSLPA